MGNDWMDGVRLRMSADEFQKLPRNPAFKYEFVDGHAYLSPRPRYFHALLDLDLFVQAPSACVASISLRQMGDNDWEALLPLFAAAFRGVVPFAGLDDEKRRQAARESLEVTRGGGDGPCIPSASQLAFADDETLVGALLVTLLPESDPTEWDAFYWPADPPADVVASRMGRPHLTWIFVSPTHRVNGIATRLLHASARALLDLGYRQLASTILLGNEHSLLWHWRSGFRLVSYPSSPRLCRNQSSDKFG